MLLCDNVVPNSTEAVILSRSNCQKGAFSGAEFLRTLWPMHSLVLKKKRKEAVLSLRSSFLKRDRRRRVA